MKQLADGLYQLRGELVCFGHGPPLRDPQSLADFISGMPD